MRREDRAGAVYGAEVGPADSGGSEVCVGKPEAAAAIWRWEASSEDGPERARRARLGAFVRALVAGLAGCLFFFGLGRPVVAIVAWSVGGLTLVLGLVSPLGAYAALDRAVRRLGDGVGLALTWLLLAPVYYLFFAPYGLLFRRGRRDPLKRALDVDAETYWRKRASRSIDKPY